MVALSSAPDWPGRYVPPTLSVTYGARQWQNRGLMATTKPRQRDYAREHATRTEHARRLGFTGTRSLRKAREAGLVPAGKPGRPWPTREETPRPKMQGAPLPMSPTDPDSTPHQRQSVKE
jgi:hypothetical protein